MQNENASYHIMIIDDSPTVRRIIEGTLIRDGYQVDSFGSGLEAINALARQVVAVPDLLLLDIGLPQMDGYNVAKLFRQHKEFKKTIIVMISARDGVIDRIRGHLVGAREYIAKPFSPGVIPATVRRLLNEAHNVSP
jgi:twitching motility two-component system response regulator PilG